MENNQIDYNKIISDVISNNIEKVVRGIYKSGTKSWKDLKVKTGSAFYNYLETAVEKYSSIKTILYRDRPVPLYDFYVDVSLSHESQVFNTSEINELINNNNRILIYGSGGIGKSTLLKHLFLNTLTNTDYIPIFVELRFINDRNQSLLDCIHNTIYNLNFDLEKDYFKASLKSGRYVFLFDGLDEVKENRRRTLIKEIIDLTDKYNSNYYILSSRRGDQIHNGIHNFSDYDMLPLNKENAMDLIEKIHYDKEVKEKFLKELDEKLYDSHQSFCSNPLLLNILLLTFSEFAEMPEKMHIFYRRAFDVLYSQHDATKAGYKRIIKVEKDISSDEFKRVLASISALSFMEKVTYFDNSSLMKYIHESKILCECSFNSEDYKHDLIESVCMLIVDGLNYKYQHRSFQEYFTAEFILSLDEESMYKLLKKLFLEKSYSFKTDMVMDLMFDMDRDKVERVFIVPVLKEIESFLSPYSKEEGYLRFMMSDFETVQHDLDLLYSDLAEKQEDAFSFTHKAKRSNYSSFTSYVREKYSDRNPKKVKSSLEKDSNSVEMFKKYAKEDNDGPRWTIELNEYIFNNEILFDLVLNHSYYFIDTLEFSLMVKDKLEEKHLKKDETRNILFKINK